MREIRKLGSEEQGAEALSLMEQALSILDKSDVAPEAGAHLDLAICRLRALLGRDGADGAGDLNVWYPTASPEPPDAAGA